MLTQREDSDDFIRRHIGSDNKQTKAILDFLGLDAIEDLLHKVIPNHIFDDRALALPDPLNERRALSSLRKIASKNTVNISMIGQGYYGTFTPKVILRNLLENPAWYTAYTPYQAEISQGRLEAVLNFQQMVTDLTGMEVAGASLLDEGTAAAEAMAMMHRLDKSKKNTFFIDKYCHPQTLDVVKTRAHYLGINYVIGTLDDLVNHALDDVFGVIIQYPNTQGAICNIQEAISYCQAHKTKIAVGSDLLALTLLKTPGSMGADIVYGSSQRFGVPMGYGGPHAAFFATRESFVRQMPGRIIGVSKDSNGHYALRMALQTREQHIRRDKATSNICTAQVLLAIMASMYAVWHGPKGLLKIAQTVHHKTVELADLFTQHGIKVVHNHYFDTLVINTPHEAENYIHKALMHDINLRYIDGDNIGISLDETIKDSNIVTLLNVFNANGSLYTGNSYQQAIPDNLHRDEPFLTHPIFSKHHSETKMMRYIRYLSDKDLALDRTMIPLGSCTMKLNAAAEMIPITWREFAQIHPFAPLEQAIGYKTMLINLQDWLGAITGFDSVSLQPNSGAQGEYTGLLCIKRYHEDNGDAHRTMCLIPESAHGTNPASAILAGMQVKIIRCDEHGNVDVAHVKELAEAHKDNLAALMITYPSTHGVFEEAIQDICHIIHDNGGQVYMDGANLNAMIGYCRPGEFGADVMHINLHKTFCIPHGGGGPGMGPIGVKRHLAPFLPDHTQVERVNSVASPHGTVGQVSSAPYGSASILPISWMYIRMSGDEGMKLSSAYAILHANYIAASLKDDYPILYSGKNGYCAHECILDMRDIKKTSSVSVEDIAKRLIDYGFHAPTMSFPVTDTLMIEPTESESLEELDRFIEAMRLIRQEIRDIEEGAIAYDDSPLHNAPHAQDWLMHDEWPFNYSKKQAYFPMGKVDYVHKFWLATGRVDNVYGDKNLFCSCISPEFLVDD